jgi:Holliday junction DNA helicase RuvA
MIGRLTGSVVSQESDGGGATVVVDVGGVGYDVVVPMGTLGRVRADDAGRVTLWVHTHVREDALALFGFSDETERAAFRSLLTVSNVGPKIAVAVLGALPAAALARAVAQQDRAALTGITGIGKKIAERLLLELRDKLPEGGPAPLGPLQAPAAPPRRGTDSEDRLRSALTHMGFKPSEAERAVAGLAGRTETAAFEVLLREALALLAR